MVLDTAERHMEDSVMKKERVRTSKKKRSLCFLVIVIILLLAYWVAYTIPITTVSVEGNVYHSAQEIEDALLGSESHRSSVYYNIRERANIKTDCIFLENYTMTWENINTVHIVVEEKPFLGYVEYTGSYLYFDENGIVIYSSQTQLEGVPLVQGIQFQQLIKYQKLNIEDEELFPKLIELTRMLYKYDLHPQTIRFLVNDEINLYMDDITVELGTVKYLEGKVQELAAMIDSLSGLKGILKLSEYDGENPQKQYYFKISE